MCACVYDYIILIAVRADGGGSMMVSSLSRNAFTGSAEAAVVTLDEQDDFTGPNDEVVDSCFFLVLIDR